MANGQSRRTYGLWPEDKSQWRVAGAFRFLPYALQGRYQLFSKGNVPSNWSKRRLVLRPPVKPPKDASWATTR